MIESKVVMFSAADPAFIAVLKKERGEARLLALADELVADKRAENWTLAFAAACKALPEDHAIYRSENFKLRQTT